MKPFKLNFENQKMTTIEYKTLDGKAHEKDVLELFLDIINEIDDLPNIYCAKLLGDLSKSSAHKLILSIYHRSLRLDLDKYIKNNYYNKEHLYNRVSPTFLYKDWDSTSIEKTFALKLKQEIFFEDANVRYSERSRSLIFLNQYNNDFLTSKPIHVNPLYLYYSPSQYALNSHFSTLIEELRQSIMESIIPNHSIPLIQQLYFQSDEFVYYHLHNIINKYIPEVLIQNQFQTSHDDLCHLLDDFPNRLNKSNQILSKESMYRLKREDFYNSYLIDHIPSFVEYVNKKPLFSVSRQPDDLLALPIPSNIGPFIKEHFYKPEDNGYITNYSIHEKLIKIEYMAFSNHKKNKKNYKLPINKNDIYIFNIGQTINSMLSGEKIPIELIDCFSSYIDNPFFLPILYGEDIESFFSNINRDYNCNLYNDVLQMYNERSNPSYEYVRTNSLGTILVAFNDSMKDDKILKVRRCKECQRFYIYAHKSQQYCCLPPIDSTNNKCKNKAILRNKDNNYNKYKDKDSRIKQITTRRKNLQRELNKDYVYYVPIMYPDKDDIIKNGINSPYKVEQYSGWNQTRRYDVLEIKDSSIEVEYPIFISYIRQQILINIYDTEKKDLLNLIENETSNKTKGELLDYTHSLLYATKENTYFPTYANSVEPFYIPTQHFKKHFPNMCTDIDWNIQLKNITVAPDTSKSVEATNELNEDIVNKYYIPRKFSYLTVNDKLRNVYRSFSSWLIDRLSAENFNTIPSNIMDSIEYISSFEKELTEKTLINKNSTKIRK